MISATTFLIVTNAGDSLTVVNVQSVSSDGSVKLLGSLDTPPSSRQQALPRAEVAVFGTFTYVLVQTATDAAGSIGTPAVVYQGKVVRLTESIYRALTFTDEGNLIVNGGPLGDRRRISSHGGLSWTDINLDAHAFSQTTIVMSLSADAALAYDTTDPTRLGIVHSDGSLTGEFTGANEGDGWFTNAGANPQQALLVGRSTGQAVTIDPVTGAPAADFTPMFNTDGGLVMTVWPIPYGRYQALIAHGPSCQPDGRNIYGDCRSIRIIDESP